LGVKKVDKPQNFGVAELNNLGFIQKTIEKPLIPKSNQALVGIYKIENSALLFEVLNSMVECKTTNNFKYMHLTDALNIMIEKGCTFNAFTVAQWYDCGQKDELIATNTMLLKKTTPISYSQKDSSNFIIINPVFIGKDCVINNSIIGPNVSIGDGVVLQSAVVKDSIVGAFARIEEIVLNNSLVGNDTYVKGFNHSLNIGDNTEIDLG
jgi:glucose-1-phosphate thymidylyltransferase